MDSSDRRNIQKGRIPLSITLRPDLLTFVKRCAASKEMGSIDEFFDTAVEALQMHMDALMHYMAEQDAKGISEDDMTRPVKCRITYHPQDH